MDDRAGRFRGSIFDLVNRLARLRQVRSAMPTIREVLAFFQAGITVFHAGITVPLDEVDSPGRVEAVWLRNDGPGPLPVCSVVPDSLYLRRRAKRRNPEERRMSRSKAPGSENRA